MPPKDLLLRLSACLPATVTYRKMSYVSAKRISNGIFDPHPLAIVYPQSSAEIAAIARLVAASDLPLAVRCGGDSIG